MHSRQDKFKKGVSLGMGNPSLQIKGVTKKFPGVLALNDINIEAYSGEVLGLIGVNGAGKSTLMNALAGVIQADTGEIIINGKTVHITSPKVAEQSGIAFIHQEAVLFPTMTVAENMFISNLKKGKSLPFIDHKQMEAEAEKYLRMLGSEINPRTLVFEKKWLCNRKQA